MSNLVAHAERELVAAGMPKKAKDDDGEGPNQWMHVCLMQLVRIFASQGHSGSSSEFCVDALNKLLRFRPLVPLTGEDAEWFEASEGIFQNRRCSSVFKTAGGQAYDLDGLGERDPVTNRVHVIFPYMPALP